MSSKQKEETAHATSIYFKMVWGPIPTLKKRLVRIKAESVKFVVADQTGETRNDAPRRHAPTDVCDAAPRIGETRNPSEAESIRARTAAPGAK